MILVQPKMTSLFRPWTEEMKSTPEGMTSLCPEEPEPPEDSTARENKYKSVKEHMKKRSEKYLLKKLKLRTEKPTPGVEKPVTGVCDNPMTSFPVCCVPTETYIPPLDCFLPRTGGFPTAEFIDPSVSQGFPSNVFEEYAKFLTEQQRIVSERSRKQRPKKFRCPHCHVGFSNNGQLKGHIRIHTGERPFKCDAESCGKSFTRNEELTRHRRIHSGLRPFPCSECGKRFGRKDHLKKHIKTHFQQRYQLERNGVGEEEFLRRIRNGEDVVAAIVRRDEDIELQEQYNRILQSSSIPIIKSTCYLLFYLRNSRSPRKTKMYARMRCQGRR